MRWHRGILWIVTALLCCFVGCRRQPEKVNKAPEPNRNRAEVPVGLEWSDADLYRLSAHYELNIQGVRNSVQYFFLGKVLVKETRIEANLKGELLKSVEVVDIPDTFLPRVRQIVVGTWKQAPVPTATLAIDVARTWIERTIVRTDQSKIHTTHASGHPELSEFLEELDRNIKDWDEKSPEKTAALVEQETRLHQFGLGPDPSAEPNRQALARRLTQPLTDAERKEVSRLLVEDAIPEGATVGDALEWVWLKLRSVRRNGPDLTYWTSAMTADERNALRETLAGPNRQAYLERRKEEQLELLWNLREELRSPK